MCIYAKEREGKVSMSKKIKEHVCEKSYIQRERKRERDECLFESQKDEGCGNVESHPLSRLPVRKARLNKQSDLSQQVCLLRQPQI